MSDTYTKVLEYMLDHPRWHYGLDFVKAGLGSRGAIYVSLARLVEDGYAEMRDDPQGPIAPGYLVRPQYRATGKRRPDENFGGEPVTG